MCCFASLGVVSLPPSLPSSFTQTSTAVNAQARTELVGAVLAAACVVTPAIGRRLSEANAGVNGGTLDVAGGEQVFAFSQALDDAAKADLAWGTFALLTQTNAQGAILYRSGGEGAGDGGGGGGEVVCARGSVRLPTTGTGVLPGSPASIIAALSKTVAASGVVNGAGAGVRARAESGAWSGTPAVADDGGEGGDEGAALYLQDRGAIDRAGANEWGFLPQGVESVLVQPAGVAGATRLVLVSDIPRAFSKKQRAWVAAIANKLAA